MLDVALETGTLKAARENCGGFLGALEDADGERDGRDRGSYRFLKAVTVLLRLKGFNSRDQMMPITEIELNGHPLLAFTMPTRAAGAPPGKPEPTVRALELAVHLARASASVLAVRLGDCELSPEGGDKCMTEVVRLVRQVGIGSQARFLEEVDLHGNHMDADAVRKIVEAAVKERCERPRACAGCPPLWLDLSGNRVRNPASVFQNLQAWAGWAHDREKALCLADQDGCSRKACASRCMLHLPGFLDQGRPEAKQPEAIANAPAAAAGAIPPLLPALPPPRPSPARRRPPEAWRPRASPATRRRTPPKSPCRRAGTPASRPQRSPGRGRRRRRSKSKSKPKPRAEVQLRPGPGFGGRSRSRSRQQGRSHCRLKSPARSASGSGSDAAGEQASASNGSPAAYSMASGSEASPSESQQEEQLGSGSQSLRSPAYDGSCSEGSASASDDGHTVATGAPSTEQLGLRINRLIESLKSSAANGGGQAAQQKPPGGRTRRREAERRRSRGRRHRRR